VTEITFHFNVPDRAQYACRLLRKATRQRARVAVTGDSSVLSALDRQLWDFDPVEFIPHLHIQAGQHVAERLRATPVWLMDTLGDGEGHDVLVNLGSEPPVGFESYVKLIEIVSTSDDDRAAARSRWRHYAKRGYPIVRHEVVES
jgi:DNA polymerase-3 subunit chi